MTYKPDNPPAPRDIIAGLTAGSVAITVADTGAGVTLAMNSRGLGSAEATLSIDQCSRLRRLLSAAEKRAKDAAHVNFNCPA